MWVGALLRFRGIAGDRFIGDSGLPALGTMGYAVSAAKGKKLLSMVWGRVLVAWLLGRGFGHPVWGIWPDG